MSMTGAGAKTTLAFGVLAFLTASCLRGTVARRLSRCELVEELLKNNFPKDQLPDWVCLVESESSRNTSAVGGPNRNGSYDYGLFQINGNIWCGLEEPGKRCNVKCEDLLADDITASCKCTHKIFKIQGFNAWFGWQKRCKGKPLPDLSKCDI